ncbi:MAG TPA: class I SAM-dependent methyltransferase [Marmoricola sp.]|nr:class I SAM-dependent methyltransferase [Marmoricola sp.]
MSTTAVPVDDAALKAKHRAMWALGDYPSVATEVIPTLGPVLVEAAGIGPGDRVLDVAAGAGNVAIPAALTGADVVASDLTPELLEAGERAAAARGAELTWRTADAEALPFADAEFDAVLSCVGVMFAPHHQAVADELVRVVRPGGTIGLVSWTPQGFIGQMFATMKPYVAPPPAGASPPPLWGDPSHVAALLGDRAEVVTAEARDLVVDRFADGEEFLAFFKATYGPTIAAYKGLEGSPERAAELDGELLELARRFTPEPGRMAWEYLLLTATRR